MEFFRVLDRDSRAMSTGQVRLFAGVAALVIAVVVAIGLVLGVFGSSEDTADGRIAFHSYRDGDADIYVMNGDGSGLVQLTDNGFSDAYPTWSPDGSRIAFVSDRDGDLDVHDIYVMNADGSGVEQLTDGCSKVHLEWSPEADRIAYVSYGDVYLINVDGSGIEQLTGEPLESCAGVFWSDRDGDGVNEAYIRNADGSVEPFNGDLTSLDWDVVDSSPAWSPDGDRIAFQSHRDGDYEIYVMNADGSGVEQLTGNEYGDELPSWSADGSRIAFTSDRDGDADIYLMNADGSGVERLTDNDYVDHSLMWSPDRGRIAFASKRDGDDGIYIMNADGSGVVRLAEGLSPAWSPLLE